MAAVARTPSITFDSHAGYAEAQSPDMKWRVTSNWTDELCAEAHLFLRTIDCRPELDGKPLAEAETKVTIDRAKAKLQRKDPVATFAILTVFDKMIGMCELKETPDKAQIEISCRIGTAWQHQGIAKWLLDLLLKEYLPAVKKAHIPIRAVVDNAHFPVHCLMQKCLFTQSVHHFYRGKLKYVYTTTCEAFSKNNLQLRPSLKVDWPDFLQ